MMIHKSKIVRETIGSVVLLLFINFMNAQSNDFVIDKIFPQLNLEIEDCDLSLLRLKELPSTPSECVAVIPVIAVQDGYYREYDSYILLINCETGKIESEFFESHETNGWISDALQLENIDIDVAPYNLTETIRAFGVRVVFHGMSRPNPYWSTTLSLFYQDGNMLRKVLSEYEVNSSSGEWDLECAGEFNEVYKILIISDHKTNGFNDIKIKSESTHTIMRKVNDSCMDRNSKIVESSLLQYKNGIYGLEYEK